MTDGARPHLFGAHLSVAGGLHLAFAAAQAAGCHCLQVFVKNQRQWVGKPLTAEAVALWKQAADQSGVAPVVAHATYLINLASVDQVIWNRSLAALGDELERCEALGISHLIFHPGAHLQATLHQGLRRIVLGLNQLHRRTRGFRTRLLLETTAGQGTAIGHRFEHLARIIEQLNEPQRVGICLDTCHLFAAGYALINQDDYESTIQQLDESIGVHKVECIHLNDSKKGLGSRVDRHEHIGCGQIGLAGFRNVVNDARFFDVPKILETPKGCDEQGRDWDVVNLRKLRRLIYRTPSDLKNSAGRGRRARTGK